MTEPILEGLPNYFEPIKRLGEGGMGVVWSVRDKRVNKVGALKVIRQKADMTSVSLTRFEREIRNFAQLIHPYIVQVYDVGQMTTGEPYIFMEQVNGEPINANLLRGRPFSEVMQLLDRILEGLDEAHANNLIHRDLKPDNILVTVDSSGNLIPKLMDFGLALRADERDMRITSDGMVVGTPIYMAPEQACDEHYQICPATDFYGIGCILYELFCGEPPFTGTNAVMVMVAQAKEKPKPFTPLPEFADAVRLSPIIHRLLEKMPDRRFETAADFRAALRRQFLIRDEQVFGTHALKHESDTFVEPPKDEEVPFFSNDLAPKTYKRILPDLEHCNYNYSVLSLRPPMFVGRSSAKNLLNRYLRDVYHSRRTAVTLVTGRPGVGKTRFVESFSHDCFRQGIATTLVVDGSVCANLRFAVYRALFAKLCLKTLTAAQVPLALCRFIQTDDEHDVRVRALEAIFDAEQAQDQPPTTQMDLVFCDIFAKFTRTRPLVLSFDNVSAEQRLELCAIARELTENPQIKLPILICVINSTTNDVPTDMELALGNESSIWLRRGINIDPLSNHDMHTLITQSLSISEELAGFIENLSSGLPQIAVNLARQWQLAGFLEPTAEGYVSKQEVAALPIPRIVHEAILRQINLTFADYPQRMWHPVAAIAAFYGEKFTPKWLASALKYIPSQQQKLISHNSFIALGLSGGVLKTLDESTLAFSNPLMREAIAATLQPYEVQDYHKAIAQALRQIPQSLATDKEIAEHLVQANQHREAFQLFLSVSRQCILCGELEQGKEYLDKASKAITQHLGYVDARTPENIDIWFLETEIYLEKGNYDMSAQVIRWLEYAVQFTPDPEKHAQYFVLRSRQAQFEGNEPLAIELLQCAVEHICAMPQPLTHEQLQIKFAALALQFQYDPSMGQTFIDTARELKDMLYVGKALLAIARYCVTVGELTRARRILNMAIDTSHKTNDMRTEAVALHILSQIQEDAPEVRLKTLYDALKNYEKLADFKALSNIHLEIAQILSVTRPDEAFIHAHWAKLLSYSQGAAV